MKQKLSLIVLGGSGSQIKQFHLTGRQTAAIVTALCLALGALVYGAVDYVSMRTKIVKKQDIEQRLAIRDDEVYQQRLQIQKFATEINELKDRIVSLDKFEQRIRVLANIDQPGSADNLFGVGGSTPEDLNPAVEVKQRHTKLIKDMHRQIKQLEGAAEVQEKDLSMLLGHLEEQKNILAHTPAIRPAKGWVTSTFSYRKSPFTGRREFHKGLDIANRKGTQIVATADGVVSFVGPNGSFGNTVVIDHGHGLITRYAHLEKELKKRGEKVHRGDVIALMGNTGRSTGPHVHYEVRLNGVPLNPMKYIFN